MIADTDWLDGDLPEDAPVEIIVSLWDRDHGGGADNYRKVFNESIKTVAAGGGAAAIGGPVGIAIGAAAAAVAKAIDLSGIVEKSPLCQTPMMI